MPTIYVLKCAQGKYYVGKTDRSVVDRLAEHMDGVGSTWTTKYPPESVIEEIQGDDFDEDKYTKIYMQKYGIGNVRGGSYVAKTLKEFELQSLQKELFSASDVCWQCGQPGHYAAACPTAKVKKVKAKKVGAVKAKTTPKLDKGTGSTKKKFATTASTAKVVTCQSVDCVVVGTATTSATSTSISTTTSTATTCTKTPLTAHSPKTDASVTTSTLCTRCGRNNHSVDVCKAQTHLKGWTLPPTSSKSSSKSTTPSTTPSTVVPTLHQETAVAQSKNIPAVRCSRCGRDGHSGDTCYAKTDKDGHALSLQSDLKCIRCGKYGHLGLLFCPTKS